MTLAGLKLAGQHSYCCSVTSVTSLSRYAHDRDHKNNPIGILVAECSSYIACNVAGCFCGFWECFLCRYLIDVESCYEQFFLVTTFAANLILIITL